MTAKSPEEPNAPPQLTLLTREQILAAPDIKDEIVDVPEWGGAVRVVAMSGHDRDEFEESMVVMRGRNRTMNLANFRANLVARSIKDEQGRRIFNDRDIVALGEKSAAALTRVVVVAQRLSGLTEEMVQELTTELKEDPSAGSGSV